MAGVARKKNVPARRKYSQRKAAVVTKRTTPYTRQSYAPAKSVISSPGVGLGQGARTVLKTCEVYNLGADATGIVRRFLYPGSANNPFGDFSNIQPTLYDQWTPIYQRYVVEKAWLKIEVATSGFNAGGTNSATCVAAYPASQNSLANPTTFAKFAGQDFAKSILLGPTDVTSTNVMTFKLDHAKVLGRKGSVTAEDNGAQFNASPVVGSAMVLPIVFVNPQAAVYNWTIRVTMYQTVWFDRRVPVVDA